MKSETMKKVTEGIVRGHVLDTAGCTDKAADELEKSVGNHFVRN